MAFHGSHLIKSWATNRSVIALSSGEAEYYGLVKAGSVSIGLKALASDMDIEFNEPIVIKSDASAAIGISNRVGSGKIRHIEVTQLWLQDKVSSREVKLNKVGTEENLADALTKGGDAATIAIHVQGVSMELREDRHRLAPSLEAGTHVELELEDE